MPAFSEMADEQQHPAMPRENLQALKAFVNASRSNKQTAITKNTRKIVDAHRDEALRLYGIITDFPKPAKPHLRLFKIWVSPDWLERPLTLENALLGYLNAKLSDIAEESTVKLASDTAALYLFTEIRDNCRGLLGGYVEWSPMVEYPESHSWGGPAACTATYAAVGLLASQLSVTREFYPVKKATIRAALKKTNEQLCWWRKANDEHLLAVYQHPIVHFYQPPLPDRHGTDTHTYISTPASAIECLLLLDTGHTDDARRLYEEVKEQVSKKPNGLYNDVRHLSTSGGDDDETFGNALLAAVALRLGDTNEADRLLGALTRAARKDTKGGYRASSNSQVDAPKARPNLGMAILHAAYAKAAIGGSA